MKKLALFLGGVLVGWFGVCYAMTCNEDNFDETLCETDDYTIKLASTPLGKVATAVVHYK